MKNWIKTFVKHVEMHWDSISFKKYLTLISRVPEEYHCLYYLIKNSWQ